MNDLETPQPDTIAVLACEMCGELLSGQNVRCPKCERLLNEADEWMDETGTRS
jgi:phage FluMu protein Com